MARASPYPHWEVPVTLIGSFAAGIALAFGHHYFYSTLHLTPVEEARWSQDTNNSVGTAFAFLVRAALVIAISTTFWQIFWLRLRRPLPLSTIDDLASQLRVLYQLLNFTALRASPLLSTLALTAWLIPLAVVFPPAALKVLPTSVRSEVMQVIETPNFNDSSAFIASMSVPSSRWKRNGMGMMIAPSQAAWDGPSAQVRRMLSGTAYQGQLPMFSSPGDNSSYRLEFIGPSIRCERMPDEAEILDDLAEAGLKEYQYLYFSWTPTENGTVAIDNSSLFGGPLEPSYIGTDFKRSQALFVTYRENLTMEARMGSSGDAAVLNCTLYNATYNLFLNYTNGRQDITVESTHVLNAITIVEPPLNIIVEGGPKWPGALGANEAEVLSYLGVMQVLGETLVGLLHWGSFYRTKRTHVLETDLAYTKELYPIFANYTSAPLTPARPLKPLSTAIEELFHNMTISLLNVPALLTPQSRQVEVSISHTLNMYHYNWQRLWIAYGAGIVAALLAVGIGIFSLITTRASYSNKFSTVVRVSRDESLGVFVRGQDRYGQDPLPEYLENAGLVVKFGDLKQDDSSITEYERLSPHTKDELVRNTS